MHVCLLLLLGLLLLVCLEHLSSGGSAAGWAMPGNGDAVSGKLSVSTEEEFPEQPEIPFRLGFT